MDVNSRVFIKMVVVSSTSERKMTLDDPVKSRPLEEAKKISSKRSTGNSSKRRKTTYSLTFADGTIIDTTRDHPFYTDNRWVSLSGSLNLLSVGSRCMNEEREFVPLINIEQLIGDYNLSVVEETYSFFVNNKLVHNDCWIYGSQGNQEVVDKTIKALMLDVQDYSFYDLLGFTPKDHILPLQIQSDIDTLRTGWNATDPNRLNNISNRLSIYNIFRLIGLTHEQSLSIGSTLLAEIRTSSVLHGIRWNSERSRSYPSFRNIQNIEPHLLGPIIRTLMNNEKAKMKNDDIRITTGSVFNGYTKINDYAIDTFESMIWAGYVSETDFRTVTQTLDPRRSMMDSVILPSRGRSTINEGLNELRFAMRFLIGSVYMDLNGSNFLKVNNRLLSPTDFAIRPYNENTNSPFKRRNSSLYQGLSKTGIWIVDSRLGKDDLINGLFSCKPLSISMRNSSFNFMQLAIRMLITQALFGDYYRTASTKVQRPLESVSMKVRIFSHSESSKTITKAINSSLSDLIDFIEIPDSNTMKTVDFGKILTAVDYRSLEELANRCSMVSSSINRNFLSQDTISELNQRNVNDYNYLNNSQLLGHILGKILDMKYPLPMKGWFPNKCYGQHTTTGKMSTDNAILSHNRPLGIYKSSILEQTYGPMYWLHLLEGKIPEREIIKLVNGFYKKHCDNSQRVDLLVDIGQGLSLGAVFDVLRNVDYRKYIEFFIWFLSENSAFKQWINRNCDTQHQYASLIINQLRTDLEIWIRRGARENDLKKPKIYISIYQNGIIHKVDTPKYSSGSDPSSVESIQSVGVAHKFQGNILRLFAIEPIFISKNDRVGVEKAIKPNGLAKVTSAVGIYYADQVIPGNNSVDVPALFAFYRPLIDRIVSIYPRQYSSFYKSIVPRLKQNFFINTYQWLISFQNYDNNFGAGREILEYLRVSMGIWRGSDNISGSLSHDSRFNTDP